MGKKKKVEDILLRPKPDRRLLAHVPDPEGVRQTLDRRAVEAAEDKRPQYAQFAGQRYMTNFPIAVHMPRGTRLRAHCRDISQTGLLLQLDRASDTLRVGPRDTCKLDFNLLPGTLQEGTEKHFKIKATLVRSSPDKGEYAFQFTEPLYRYLRRTKDGWLFSLAAFFLFLVTLVILLLRTESVVYFAANRWLYLYSIITAAFLLTRYLFGGLYKPVSVDPAYTPSIAVVIPCFNEEEWIDRTILSCIDQDYPPDKLHIIIVDDGSTDGSVKKIQETVTRLWNENARFRTRERIKVFFQKTNQGKREAMALGIRNATTELVGFVDSDSFLEPDAIRNLVQPFFDPKVGGVAGRTDVVNAYTNALTKMQSVRYYGNTV